MPAASSLAIQQNVALAPFTTLRIGGLARFFAQITSEQELEQGVAFARQNQLRLFILGGGSNLLVSDSGFDGLVLHVALDGAMDVAVEGDTILYTVPAGVEWNVFVLATCKQELSGVECLAGIPGLVGGTPVQNVGAYGQEVSETIESVRAFDLDTGIFIEIPHADCGFAYRRSIFNSTSSGRYIVTAVRFRFSLETQPRLIYTDLSRHFGDRNPTSIEIYHAVRQIRRGKGMLLVEGDPDALSAGSFFKNPVVSHAAVQNVATALNLVADKIPQWAAGEGTVKLPAAWLLEQTGFHKGYVMGNAGISSRHTLAVINRGRATAADIIALRNAIIDRVEQRFGIRLEQEPVLLGNF